MQSASKTSTIDFDLIVKILKKDTKRFPDPLIQQIMALYGNKPYLILMSCLLSLQSRDVVTLPVSIELFKLAKTPQEMVELPLTQIQQTLKSINYFKTKAKLMHTVSHELLYRFEGKVPADISELLSIKGVGLKTANLVLAEAFGVPAICVDTHVHRLSNHWGIVHSKTPEQTESALKKILPLKHWIIWNYLLVKYGQWICKSKKKCTQETCKEILDIVKNS
ncbi:MAG TPA: endonuclease III [Candidatus Saccharimonadales bacterium]|nr:endonuclease III [Candidatus Saccharimonadales bacterium]